MNCGESKCRMVLQGGFNSVACAEVRGAESTTTVIGVVIYRAQAVLAQFAVALCDDSSGRWLTTSLA